MGRTWGIGTAASAAATVLLFVIGLAVGTSNSASGAKKSGKSPASSTPSTTTGKHSKCGGYNVVLDKNEGNKVISAAKAELPMDNPANTVKVVMRYARHDPRILQLYWNSSPLGKKNPVKNWKKLVDDGCYNSHARDLYQQTLAQYESASATKSTAPSQGVNTGVQAGGGQPFQETPGVITGDLRAVKVVFLNGNVVYILHRCGNLVTSAPIPGVPTKPVTPPTTPGTVPPTTEKPRLSWSCQQNGEGCPPGVNPAWHQPVQDPPPPGVDTGPTPGYTPPSGGGNPAPPVTVAPPVTSSPPATMPQPPTPTAPPTSMVPAPR